MKRSALTILGLAWLVVGCNGQGCSSLTPLALGFPAAKRVPNATQLRVSDTGLAKLEAQPSVVASQLLGGSLAFNFSASCGGSPATCCPGGVPASPCGPLLFDVEPQMGDAPRVVLSPVQGSSRIDVTLRARLATETDVPINVPSVGDCGLRIDTTPGATEDVAIIFSLNLVQDALAGTTRIAMGNIVINDLTTDDVALIGLFGCQFASVSLSFVINTLVDTIADQVKSSLDASLCKACPSGDVGECGVFAVACTDQVCMTGGECLQELGVVGRLASGALFGGAPPGGTGTLDVHEIAGGYATTNNGGAAFGVLAGLIPSGAERDRCGPPASEPTPVVVPQSAYFQGNSRPDTAAPFEFAIGLHTSQVERFAYAAYEGGVLCPTFDTTALPALSSDALAVAIPSLANLTGGNRPIAVGLRPQAPPTFVLGANTFDGSDAVVEPLLDFSFDGMEIDLFANVEDQPIRLLTLVADVRLPIGVQIDAAGQLVAVLGGAAGVDNVTVQSSEPLQESKTELAALAPLLIDPVLPELVRRLDLSQVPLFLGMQLAFTSVTTVESQSFVALFADLQPPPGMGGTTRSASAERGAASARRLAAGDASRLAFLALIALALACVSRRRVRRWAVGPVLVAVVIALPVACGDDAGIANGAPDGGSAEAGADSGSHGTGGDGRGDSSDSGTGGIDGGQAGSGGDAGTSNPCGTKACKPGNVVGGELGQWNSVATGKRTVIASYDAVLGDLVLVELAGGAQERRVIDGIPAVTPTHEPEGYRGGVEAAGPDVGAWTSVRLAGSRVAVAYQDRDRGALRAAFEDADGVFHPHDVDDSKTEGVEIGAYASLALATTPSIAYLATGVPRSNGDHRTELRLATAASKTPKAKSDWTTTVVASAVAEAPAVQDLPGGPGLFVNLIVLADGRRILVHYDHSQGALVAHVEKTAGGATFDKTVLDGGGVLDRGRWVSAVADDAGTVHVAYEDSIGHQVFYRTFTPGGALGVPELVDDGTRAGDRPHWVGAGLVLWLDGGRPRVAYQDAATANVVVARRSGSWSHADAAKGAALDGFHLAAPAQGKGPLVWDRMDSATAASHRLVILDAP